MFIAKNSMLEQLQAANTPSKSQASLTEASLGAHKFIRMLGQGKPEREGASWDLAVRQAWLQAYSTDDADAREAGEATRTPSRLPGYVRAFGHYLYDPSATPEQRNTAEAAVLAFAYDRLEEPIPVPWDELRWIASAALHRYRTRCPAWHDPPLDSPLESSADASGGQASASERRVLEDFAHACQETCADLDRQALAPLTLAMHRSPAAA